MNSRGLKIKDKWGLTSGIFNVRLSISQEEEIKKMSLKMGYSRGNIIRFAIDEFLKNPKFPKWKKHEQKNVT